MKQRTHAWLAVSAISLLEESDKAEKLVKLLAPYAKSAAIGAWLPDLSDSKKGFGRLDNHILKMEPYDGPLPKRFVMSKNTLVEELGEHRKMAGFLDNDSSLDNQWWKQPYKADPTPGKHLANRAMAFATMIVDLLILGDKEVDALVPGEIGFIENMNKKALTRKEQLATYFFMISHFIADACMPCHCDARLLSGYDKGVHNKLESRWNRRIGTYFDKDNLLTTNDKSATVIDKAREIWEKLDISIDPDIPDLAKGHDTWLEIIYVCRASYALANIIVPAGDFPADSQDCTTLNDLYPDPADKKKLAEFDRLILHDAILNIAIIWKHIWDRF